MILKTDFQKEIFIFMHCFTFYIGIFALLAGVYFKSFSLFFIIVGAMISGYYLGFFENLLIEKLKL